MIWIPHSRYQVLKRLLWRADDFGVVIKKDQMHLLTVPAEVLRVTDFHVSKYWEVRTSRGSFLSLVTVGDDVWLYKKLQYMIRNSINKQLNHLDLLSLHRITLCHFYDSSQTRIQSIIRTIYHLLDGALFHWVAQLLDRKEKMYYPSLFQINF